MLYCIYHTHTQLVINCPIFVRIPCIPCTKRCFAIFNLIIMLPKFSLGNVLLLIANLIFVDSIMSKLISHSLFYFVSHDLNNRVTKNENVDNKLHWTSMGAPLKQGFFIPFPRESNQKMPCGILQIRVKPNHNPNYGPPFHLRRPPSLRRWRPHRNFARQIP